MIFSEKPRIIYNDDTCSLRTVDPPHTVDRVANALDYLRGSQVDCLCWCLSAGDIAFSWASDVVDNAFDMAAKDPNLNLAGMTHGRNLMLGLHRQGIDYLPRLIELTHERGLTFVGSFRMNDSHHKSRPHGILASTFWHEHQDWRLWEVTYGRTYYNACLDYSYPEVRQVRLDCIEEVMERYDLDGIELDWCRNPFAFQPSEAWEKRHILTDFTHEIRAIIDQAAERRGRQAGLIIRVPLQDWRREHGGIDIEAWIEQGLADVLVMSYSTNNYNADFSRWMAFCAEHDVLFYPSVELGPTHNSVHNHVVPETLEEGQDHTRAAAQNVLAQEPDGLYMFNFPCRLYENVWDEQQFRRVTSVLSEVGSLETLQGTSKQYAFWENLPMQLESNRPPQFYQTIHFTIRDPEIASPETKVTISFREIAEANPHATETYEQDPVVPDDWVTIILNGRELPGDAARRTEQPAGTIVSGFDLDRHVLVEIDPPDGLLVEGENTLAFHIDRFPEETHPYVHIHELIVSSEPIQE